MHHSTEEIIGSLNEMAERGLVLTGPACGVIVNPTLLRISAERLGELQGSVNEFETQHRIDMCESGYDCAQLGKIRRELEKARPTPEVLEAIDELVGYARPRMSTSAWLGIVNPLGEWRGQFERKSEDENNI